LATQWDENIVYNTPVSRYRQTIRRARKGCLGDPWSSSG